MHLKIISCNVLFREVCLAAAYSENVIDMEFLEKGLHDEPDKMREVIQTRIDATDEKLYDAIVLVYALCSNGLANINAPGIPLIIPKAHDCITLFLGSKESYMEHHNRVPGTYYYTSGWLERSGGKVQNNPQSSQDQVKLKSKYQQYVEKYGEDNAKYLMEFENSWVNNYTCAAYIDVGLVEFPEYEEKVRHIAEQNNWTYEKLTGNMRLIKDLIDGKWNKDEFLTVPPHHKIVPSYDEGIITCKLL
ncbi:DUF1638 domain-containing protein [Candidatus Poribacteria bacterium]|nr:DUF1638 domain-containing protein [Candidatus Poribacteria bacterium]